MKSSKQVCEFCNSSFNSERGSRFCSPICRSRSRYPPKQNPFFRKKCAICRFTPAGIVAGCYFCEEHFILGKKYLKLFRRSLK
jgi:hypothetical protein